MNPTLSATPVGFRGREGVAMHVHREGRGRRPAPAAFGQGAGDPSERTFHESLLPFAPRGFLRHLEPTLALSPGVERSVTLNLADDAPAGGGIVTNGRPNIRFRITLSLVLGTGGMMGGAHAAGAQTGPGVVPLPGASWAQSSGGDRGPSHMRTTWRRSSRRSA